MIFALRTAVHYKISMFLEKMQERVDEWMDAWMDVWTIKWMDE